MKNLLVASNPAKSIFYRSHTLYPDGRKETIDNVGEAQIINFNGKDYIVWFEMMKAAEGMKYMCAKRN